mmetsp:Transcript_35049/g.89656  ORF Transcript_35049/g.89656 Transcript_35049/m.89656 type:complete len:397 (+) Transcript_35049:114-1304(+)
MDTSPTLPDHIQGAEKPKKQRKLKYCQIEGCGVDLRTEPLRNWQVKTCRAHQRADMVEVDGVGHRYCQQCVRFHTLDMFDGDKRGCRERLDRHNRRRQLKHKKPTADSEDEQERSQAGGRDAVPVRLPREEHRGQGSKRVRDPVTGQMQDEYGFDPAHVGGDMRPSKVPMYNASRASTAYYKFSEDPPQRAPVGDRSLPNYWSDRVPGLPARVSPAMRALEGIAPGAGSSRSEDDQVRRTRASPPGRRWTTRSTHSTSDDMGEVLWSEAGRYWGGAPFPPPYPFPPEYSTWMGSRPAMDAPSVDPNLHLWLRHVQETMRRYPAQEGPMAPYPRHFPALPGRVGPHPFGAPLHEELRGNRRPKTPQRSGGDEGSPSMPGFRDSLSARGKSAGPSRYL